jgi:hypothetical protein
MFQRHWCCMMLWRLQHSSAPFSGDCSVCVVAPFPPICSPFCSSEPNNFPVGHHLFFNPTLYFRLCPFSGPHPPVNPGPRTPLHLPIFSVQWSVGQMLPIYPCHIIHCIFLGRLDCWELRQLVSSNTSGTVHPTMQHHIPQDSNTNRDLIPYTAA